MLASSLLPTRGSAAVDAPSVQPSDGDEHVEPQGLGDRARDVFVLGVRDDDAWVEHLERRRRFGLGEVGVDRRDRGAELAGAVAHLERLERGGTPPGDAVTDGHAGRREAVRGACRAGVELAEGPGIVAEGGADAVGADRRQAGQDVVDPDVERHASVRRCRAGARPELADRERRVHLVALVLRALVGRAPPIRSGTS